jgi:hypothetical protein
MRKKLVHFSTRAFIGFGLLALGFQLPAHAQEITLNASPDPLVGTTHQTATLTIQLDAVLGTGDALGVTISFQVPKGLSVSVPSNCAVARAQGTSSVLCTLDVPQGTSQFLDIDFSANKADSWGLDLKAGCSVSVCQEVQQGLLITFSH